MDVEVESSDVVRVVLQYLKENQLYEAAQALQHESGVSLNTVDNAEHLMACIRRGKWHEVLPVLSALKLPSTLLVDLYEHIILELLELRETEVARSLLRDECEAMNYMRHEDTERFLKLEHLAKRSYFDEHEAYSGGRTREQRRNELAQAIEKEIEVVPPSRLLSLINQALKWQRHMALLPAGEKFDLFRGTMQGRAVEEEEPVDSQALTIKFAKSVHPESAIFSPDGQNLITGSTDGFIEVWNFLTGKLRKDLSYQAEDKFMMHKDAVLSLNCSADSELLVSGSQGGQIKVWQLSTGKCVRRFSQAHTGGVTSVAFGSKDQTHVLSSSFDKTVRIHGINSGKTLKMFRGHTSYVNNAVWSANGSNVLSCSSDGTVRMWDVKTTDCVKTFTLEQSAGLETTVNNILWVPNTEELFVCDKSGTLHRRNMNGQVVMTIRASDDDARFLQAIITPSGKFIYAITESNDLICFSVADGRQVSSIKIHSKELIGLCHHPHRNLLATYANHHHMILWKAPVPEV